MQSLKNLYKGEETIAGGMTGTQIFMMLPMDIVAVGEVEDGHETSFIRLPCNNPKLFDWQLSVLRQEGVAGVMVDVWWGLCERHGPRQYDFAGYLQLFKKAERLGLKVQVVMSFHAGGGNVGDGSVDIPLPKWVLEAGEQLGDEIFYTDASRGRDHECLSLGVDHEPVLAGRTPLQCYADFVEEFAQQCRDVGLWGTTVVEVMVGMGPCGELRYPAYQEKDQKWSFFGQELATGGSEVRRGIPGIGEFQCHDRYMLADLAAAANAIGKPEWSQPPNKIPGFGPGGYVFAPWETEFFNIAPGAGWQQPYGQFFMEWYSGRLVQHCADVLDAVLPQVHGANRGMPPHSQVAVGTKVAGIHWWYRAVSHPAEMTAGYYNYYGHDGYEPIMRVLKERDVGFAFTCIEMSDDDNPELRHCSPEGLVAQIISAAQRVGVHLMAENALEGGIYSSSALERMRNSAHNFTAITLLRLRDSLFVPGDSPPENLRVRQPLKGFLNHFLAINHPEMAGSRDEDPSTSAAAPAGHDSNGDGNGAVEGTTRAPPTRSMSSGRV